MKTIYLLDWLISKHVKVKNVPDHISFDVGEKVVYLNPEDNKQYIGLNVWYELECEKEWKFVQCLEWQLKEKFEEYQKRALQHYKDFKQKFTKEFEGAVPITARSDLHGRIIYFYFYSEDRYNFSEFVRSFRQQLPCQFFIYQVGARDMMRLSPHAKDYLSACGCGPLGCCSLGKLPSVEMDNIALQGLEWRDVEKLKWRCGKLKCSIVFERSLYLEETKKFPKKGETVTIPEGITWQCIGHNIMTGEITLKTEKWEIHRTTL